MVDRMKPHRNAIDVRTKGALSIMKLCLVLRQQSVFSGTFTVMVAPSILCFLGGCIHALNGSSTSSTSLGGGAFGLAPVSVSADLSFFSFLDFFSFFFLLSFLGDLGGLSSATTMANCSMASEAVSDSLSDMVENSSGKAPKLRQFRGDDTVLSQSAQFPLD